MISQPQKLSNMVNFIPKEETKIKRSLSNTLRRYATTSSPTNVLAKDNNTTLINS